MSWCHYVTDRGLLGLNVDLSLDKMFPNVDAETGTVRVGFVRLDLITVYSAQPIF